ncbi:anthranilate phosphoribosyltransferase [Bacillus sp. FJAT-45350]|uniref:anthranilate phosphoribosyltransferase n=1 Tax=Bacillus sp. FJAT-45350 TaxID=2011014 RepID=UPI000BB8B60E|nr:anthranilate phosphoribosyltransferase [Bacillus sp. FJAT-45350]
MFKEILAKCIDGATLTEVEAKTIMDEIMTGKASPSQISSLLSILRFRGETVDEMTGFARSMKSHVTTIPHQEGQLIDTCGTGGDKAKTFNISTVTAIVLSSMGVKVAKHGNRAVSSKSGSADVLENLGVSIQGSPEEAASALKSNGMCFLFAPLYHHAMKHAVTPRKEIGFRTIFNLLGPMTNPANADRQLIGVFDTNYAEKMASTLQRLGTKRAMLVTGGEGLDECSISTHTNVVELRNGIIERYTITPEEVGLKRGPLSDIQVQSTEESARMIESIIHGEGNETATNIVLLNTAAGLYVSDEVETLKEGVQLAKEALTSGKVFEQFQRLQVERQEINHA